MPATGAGSDSDGGESECLEDSQALHQELEALKAALGDKYVRYLAAFVLRITGSWKALVSSISWRLVSAALTGPHADSSLLYSLHLSTA
jgi:hypothetical protein